MNVTRFSGIIGIFAGLAFASSAHAQITYTFQGIGSGQFTAPADPQTFTNSDFSFVFSGNPINIISAPPSFYQYNLGGTFTAGTISAILNPDNIVSVNNNPSTPRVGFFNSIASDGAAIQNSAFQTYDLAGAFGPITGTGASLLPDLGGGSFDTQGGGTVQLTDVTSLTFTASTSTVPEPTTLALLSTGLVGLGAIRRRKTV